MPKIESKLQDFVFGVLMVTIMVIFMVTYNIALQHGGVNMEVLSIVAQAIWAPMIIAFIVENLFVGKVAKRIAFKVVDPTHLCNASHLSRYSLLYVSHYDTNRHITVRVSRLGYGYCQLA